MLEQAASNSSNVLPVTSTTRRPDDRSRSNAPSTSALSDPDIVKVPS